MFVDVDTTLREQATAPCGHGKRGMKQEYETGPRLTGDKRRGLGRERDKECGTGTSEASCSLRKGEEEHD